MKRILLCVLALVCSAYAQTATITGQVNDPGTSGSSVNTHLRFELKGCFGNQPRYNGVALLWPVVKVYETNDSGSASGTIYRNDYITCGSSTDSNYWEMRVSQNGQLGAPCNVRIAASTFDATQPNCLNQNPAVSVPTDSTLFALLNATNQPFTGHVTAPSLRAKGDPVYSVTAYGAVCDGTTNDATAIQAAIDAAEVTGGTVLFPKTVCGVGAASWTGLEIGASNVTLQGGDKGGLKVLALPTQTITNYGATVIKAVSRTNIRIKGLYIDGNSIAANQVGLESCTNCEVSDNYIFGGGLQAQLILEGGSRNKVTNNTVFSGTGTALGMWIGHTPSSGSWRETNPVVTGNVVYSNPATGIATTVVGGVISNNVSNSNAGSGIIASADGAGRGHATIISNNVMNFNGFHGFQSDSTTNSDYAEFIDVTGNHAEGNNGSGIYAVRIRDSAFTNNVLVDNNADAPTGSGFGILVEVAKRILIANNSIYDTRSGASRTQDRGINLLAQSGGSLAIEDISITSNLIRNNLSGGILLEQQSGHTVDTVLIANNLLVENGGYGLRTIEAVGGELANVTVSNNVVLGNTTGQTLFASTTREYGNFTTANQTSFNIANGQIVSTLATGTAPLAVSSTTKVSNLNVDQVDGGDWAAPIAIGTGTPAAGTFTALTGATYLTASNCSSSAAPAVCGSAAAGSVVIAAAGTTVTVNTTAVTANSQIIITEDSSLGTKLSVTCNTTLGRNYAVTARTAATSFVITTDAAPVTNPACLSFVVVN